MRDGSRPSLPPGSGVPPIIGDTRQPPPLPATTHRPGVLLAYRCWCLLFVLLYLSFCVVKILEARGDLEPSLGLMETAVSADNPQVRQEIIAKKRAEAPGMAVGMGAVALLYGAAAGISRKPGSWTLGLIVICTTVFPFVVTLAGTVPLLVHWIKPETKLYFNRRP